MFHKHGQTAVTFLFLQIFIMPMPRTCFKLEEFKLEYPSYLYTWKSFCLLVGTLLHSFSQVAKYIIFSHNKLLIISIFSWLKSYIIITISSQVANTYHFFSLPVHVHWNFCLWLCLWNRYGIFRCASHFYYQSICR